MIACPKRVTNTLTLKHKKELKEKDDKLRELQQTIKDMKQEYESKISALQDKIENIAIKAATKSTTTTNNKNRVNYIQNMQPITDQHLTDNLPFLTVEHVKKGAEGYAQYALEYPLKDRVACVDYSRRKVKYKDHDGNVITDPDMSNLTQKFFKSISDRNKDLFKECAKEFREKCDEASFDKMALLAETLAGVNESAGGSSSDFSHEFVKEVCKATISE
jgi:gas vesicle protein